MASSSALSNTADSHWSMMKFANRSNIQNPGNNTSSLLSSAVANSVDSLSVAVESSTCTTSSLDDHVFPSELRRILNQVAHSGACSSLSWVMNSSNHNSSNNNTSNSGNNNVYAISRHRLKKQGMKRTTSPSISKNNIIVNNTSDGEHFSSDGENTLSSNSSSLSKQSFVPKIRYNSLREAVAHALLIVLDRAYKKTGYTLSPAERKKLKKEKDVHLADCAFCDRKEKLLEMLLGENFKSAIAKFSSSSKTSNSNPRTLKKNNVHVVSETSNFARNPPFTMQRVAEILFMPEQYYTQTHKLCNALEKLLLVTSSTNAFGGSSGGELKQRLDEEREKKLLAGERGRENEQRRIKRRISYGSPNTLNISSSSSSEALLSQAIERTAENKLVMDNSSDLGDEHLPQISQSPLNHFSSGIVRSSQDPIATTNGSEKSFLESGNSKAVLLKSRVNKDVVRQMTTNESMVASIANFTSHISNPKPPDNIILNANNEKVNFDSLPFGSKIDSYLIRDYAVITSLTAENNSLSPGIPNIDTKAKNSVSIQTNRMPFSSLSVGVSGIADTKLAEVPSAVEVSKNLNPSGGLPIGAHSRSLHTQSVLTSLQHDDSVKVEFELASIAACAAPTSASSALDLDAGRSSASTSDSESCDDVDDSASDRSDGSDSGYNEPFTAARVMTLNRMQQQQRREQSLLNRATAGGANSSNFLNDFRPPSDSEYQSGDSIDSTMAEDSCGSDSSSSDIAD